MSYLDKLQFMKEENHNVSTQLELEYRIFILTSYKDILESTKDLHSLDEVTIHKEAVYRLKEAMFICDHKKWNAQAATKYAGDLNYANGMLSQFRLVSEIEEYQRRIYQFLQQLIKNWWDLRELGYPIF